LIFLFFCDVEAFPIIKMSVLVAPLQTETRPHRAYLNPTFDFNSNQGRENEEKTKQRQIQEIATHRETGETNHLYVHSEPTDIKK